MKTKRKRKKRGTKRILGNDRGIMMICKDIRRRWCQYGENRKVQDNLHCAVCKESATKLDIDHIVPMGPRPRTWEDLGIYARRMFTIDCQALCKVCHKHKTDLERKGRKYK